MPDNIKHLFEHALPFMVAAHHGEGPKLNTMRMLEAVIIAAVLGGLGWMFLIPELKLEFGYMKRDIGRLSTKVDAIQIDVNQLKVDAAVEKARH